MRIAAFPSSSAAKTKSLLAISLTCLSAVFLADPTARGSQTAVVSLVEKFTGVVPSGEQGANLPPVTPPFKASDGNYYGIAPIGGTYGNGIVYKVTAAGVYSVLHNFHDNEFSEPLVEEGNEPRVLFQGADGNLYGVCFDGGKSDDNVNFNGGGTIFKITLSGTYTKLYDFDTGNANIAPVLPVAFLQASDGNFYGLTNNGGKSANAAGAFFRFDASTKTLTEVTDFINTNTIGVEPKAQLLDGKDGSFYGTTSTGGGTDPNAKAQGTLFKVTTAGKVTLLHAFQSDPENPDSQPPAPDGTPLTLGTDGYLYGASAVGGDDDYGTVYRCLTTGGSFLILHNFANGTDGGYPFGGLVEAADGNFYGGLQFGFGTASQAAGGYFQIKTSGAFTLLSKFSVSSDTNPYQATSRLTEISPGTFYGQTQGGTNGLGTLVKVIVSPVITSAAASTATVGHAFIYRTTATNGPTSFAATGVPAGLSFSTATGVISGTPTTAGTFHVAISAKNAAGTGTLTLTLTIRAATAAAPVITSATTATAYVNKAFTYDIEATNSPTSYAASGLPTGLTINTSTGVISGTPKNAGKAAVTISATNATGTGTARVTITILAAPVITSATTATLGVNKAFTYRITATNSPTSYAAPGLPTGLTINTATGVISGTAKNAGKAVVTISATNAAGTGSTKLTLTIEALPAITSATAATATVNKAFTYHITASNSPTSFAASGLPTGLSINTTTGLISGTPKNAGKATITVSAINAAGAGTAKVTITIAN